MDPLKYLCEESLIKHELKLETASDLLQFATIHNAAKLKDSVEAYIEK